MAKSYRPQRLGEEIKKIISSLLSKGELEGSAFRSMISISGVSVTKDGSYATVYITAIDTSGRELSEEKKTELIEAFAGYRGFIRSAIAQNIRVRHVCDLVFKFDESMEYGFRIDKILSELPDLQSSGSAGGEVKTEKESI